MTVQTAKPQLESLDTLVDHILDHAAHPLAEPDLARWCADLQARLAHVHQHPEQNLGCLEETIRQSALELQRRLVEQAMQRKADAVAETCPTCQAALTNKKRRVTRCVRTYCGPAKLRRTHGWCPHCETWCFPADTVLGLRDDSTASPLVQEICALRVTKMPAEQAEAISQRVTGRALSRSTLAREAQRQGDHALTVRARLVQAPSVDLPARKLPAAGAAPPAPFTLVIQMDAWNIRERDHWGDTAARRRRHEETNRWHWVYTATCFHVEQRTRKGKGQHPDKQRAIITERSYVATRGGIDALREQLYYEARVRGLAQAERVLVIADGAVWIWHLAEDRFPQAIQRLDLYHANTYLWAVANELHGAGTPEARHWVKPLLKQIRNDQTAQVITQLEDLQPRLSAAAAKATAAAISYYQTHQARMKYKAARRRNEPVGSGAIESTCRQLQCRMKRCGQFWSERGDEALLCLDLFWRNERWEQLFPHVKLTAVTNN